MQFATKMTTTKLAPLGVLVALTACGGRLEPLPVDADPAPGRAGSEPAPATPEDPLPEQRGEGYVTVVSTPDAVGAYAGFHEGRFAKGEPLGTCEARVAAAGSPVASLDAGTIVVEKRAFSGHVQRLSLAFDPARSEYGAVSARSELSGALTSVVRVHASGGSVPAFDASVEPATAITLEAPVDGEASTSSTTEHARSASRSPGITALSTATPRSGDA
jgi:hypothetical protein